MATKTLPYQVKTPGQSISTIRCHISRTPAYILSNTGPYPLRRNVCISQWRTKTIHQTQRSHPQRLSGYKLGVIKTYIERIWVNTEPIYKKKERRISTSKSNTGLPFLCSSRETTHHKRRRKITQGSSQLRTQRPLLQVSGRQSSPAEVLEAYKSAGLRCSTHGPN